jgi:multiple sugar transport system permease protein
MTTTAVAGGRRRILTNARREALEGFLGISPWILGFLIFTIGPILYTFWLSFTKYNILQPPVFAGLRNFENMFFKDDLFWHSLKLTAIYTVASVPLGIIVGYALALLLNQKVAGLSFWRTACYMPSIVPVLASSYIFMYLFQGDIGLLNALLRQIGIQGPSWFGSREWVMPAFILMSLWGAGANLILYLSALQGVPRALYDASKVDGASAWRRFWNVMLPMTSPVIFFTFLTGMIGSFQIFGSAFIVTGGGPANASLFYVLYLYRNGWNYLEMGYAAALALVLFILILGLTVVTLKVAGRLVYYETGETG